MKEDGEAVYCMYAVLNFHWTPSQFNSMGRKEKAFVMACIDKRVQAEEESRRR